MNIWDELRKGIKRTGLSLRRWLRTPFLDSDLTLLVAEGLVDSEFEKGRIFSNASSVFFRLLYRLNSSTEPSASGKIFFRIEARLKRRSLLLFSKIFQRFIQKEFQSIFDRQAAELLSGYPLFQSPSPFHITNVQCDAPFAEWPGPRWPGLPGRLFKKYVPPEGGAWKKYYRGIFFQFRVSGTDELLPAPFFPPGLNSEATELCFVVSREAGFFPGSDSWPSGKRMAGDPELSLFMRASMISPDGLETGWLPLLHCRGWSRGVQLHYDIVAGGLRFALGNGSDSLFFDRILAPGRFAGNGILRPELLKPTRRLLLPDEQTGRISILEQTTLHAANRVYVMNETNSNSQRGPGLSIAAFLSEGLRVSIEPLAPPLLVSSYSIRSDRYKIIFPLEFQGKRRVPVKIPGQ